MYKRAKPQSLIAKYGLDKGYVIFTFESVRSC